MNISDIKETIQKVRDNVAAADEDTKILNWHSQRDWDGFGEDIYAVYSADKETNRNKVVGGLKSKPTAQLIEQAGRMGVKLCDMLDESLEAFQDLRAVVKRTKALAEDGNIGGIQDLLGVQGPSPTLDFHERLLEIFNYTENEKALESLDVLIKATEVPDES
jgi:hypothetical protein